MDKSIADRDETCLTGRLTVADGKMKIY